MSTSRASRLSFRRKPRQGGGGGRLILTAVLAVLVGVIMAGVGVVIAEAALELIAR